MCTIYRCFVLFILITQGIEGGILTGDLKLKSKPLTINSHHAPININIGTDKLKSILPPLSLPKPAKPPPKDLSELLKPSFFSKSKHSSLSSRALSKFAELPSLSEFILPKPKSILPKLTESIFPPKSIFPSKSILSRKLSRSTIFSKPSLPELPSIAKPLLPPPKISPLSKLSVPVLPPVMPLIPPPLLPLPLIPPMIPPFPLIPLIPPMIPGLPLVPGLPIGSPLRPLKVPILGGKSALQQALGSEISPVVVDIKEGTKNVIVEKKLRNLLKRGSLTITEFNRFKKLLVG